MFEMFFSKSSPSRAVRLFGGLGNQLFQIAFAYQLSRQSEIPVLLESSSFRGQSVNRPHRRLEINPKTVEFEFISMPSYLELITRYLGYPYHVTEELTGGNTISHIDSCTRLFTGYFQSWKLAEDVSAPMKRLLENHFEAAPTRTPFVAVHSRLGDYLVDHSTSSFHGVTSPAWLLQEARELKSELGVDQIRIFTDSPRHFISLAGVPESKDLIFDDSLRAWPTLSNMHHAAGFVLSNSSLSWWAAFAARHILGSEAPVVAPRPWLAANSASDAMIPHPSWRMKERVILRGHEKRVSLASRATIRDDLAFPKAFYTSELVICTRNRFGSLGTCLESVFRANEVPKRVVIVDSSDDEETERLINKLHKQSPVELFYQRGPIGLTLQRNLGLRLLRPSTKIVHFIDDDVVLHPDYFIEIDAAFAADTAIAGVGGKVTNTDPLKASKIRDLMFLGGLQGSVVRSGHNIMARDYREPTKVQWLSGCSMSYRTGLIAGLRFDVRRSGYGLGEDVDFSMRASERGSLVWTPAARLEHHQGDRGADYYFEMSRLSVRNRWLIASDHLGQVRHWAVIYGTFAWVARGASESLMRRDFHRALKYRAGIQGLFDLLLNRGDESKSNSL